jgi:hypothetical protein
MGVGDDKGGLSWMVDRWPPGCDFDDSGHRLRALSKETYLAGMGWSDRDLICSDNDLVVSKEEELLCTAFESWNISPDDLTFGARHHLHDDRVVEAISLDAFVDISEHLSAADVFCRGRRIGLDTPLDPSHPLPSTKTCQSYTESYPLLPVYSTVDFAGVDTKMVVYTTLLSHKSVSLSNSGGTLRCEDSINEESFVKIIVDNKIATQTEAEITRMTFSAMDPIAGDIVSDSGIVTASCFDREFRVLVEDIAPYVRSIAEHDLVLEAARAQSLSSTKRARTSRASRSALEGGRREEKRRERWFTKDLNLQQVLKTGGTAWYQRSQEMLAADSPSTATSNTP